LQNIMDYVDEQHNEMEALSSIYCGELEGTCHHILPGTIYVAEMRCNTMGRRCDESMASRE